MYKRYIVCLTDEERGRIGTLLRRGRAHTVAAVRPHPAQGRRFRGRPRLADERIAEAMETSTDTVARERRRFVEDRLEVALMAKKPGKQRRRGIG